MSASTYMARSLLRISLRSHCGAEGVVIGPPGSWASKSRLRPLGFHGFALSRDFYPARLRTPTKLALETLASSGAISI
jgi:hypothetical protein